jgi:hypothetical protein
MNRAGRRTVTEKVIRTPFRRHLFSKNVVHNRVIYGFVKHLYALVLVIVQVLAVSHEKLRILESGDMVDQIMRALSSFYSCCLLFMHKTSILVSMKFRSRLFVVVLVMLGLPLQGALAAIMPLCAQAPQSAQPHQALNPFPAFETQNHSSSPASPCTQHDMDNAEESAPEAVDQPDEMALTCDGTVCHISGNGLPAFTVPVNSPGGFSYPAVFNIHFTSLILKQLQRPPLS